MGVALLDNLFVAGVSLLKSMWMQRNELFRPQAVSGLTDVNLVTLRSWHQRGLFTSELEVASALAKRKNRPNVRLLESPLREALGDDRVDQLNQELDDERKKIHAATAEVLAGGHRLYTWDDVLQIALMRLLTVRIGMRAEAASGVLPFCPAFEKALEGDVTLEVEPTYVGEGELEGYWGWSWWDEPSGREVSIRIDFTKLARGLKARMESAEISPSFVLEIREDVKLEKC